jgi:hypothetical protein
MNAFSPVRLAYSAIQHNIFTMQKIEFDVLKSEALRLLKAHSKTIVFATEDGNFFFDKQDALVQNAALIKLHEDDGLKVLDFSTTEEVEAEIPVLNAEAASALALEEAAAKIAEGKKEPAPVVTMPQGENKTDAADAEEAVKADVKANEAGDAAPAKDATEVAKETAPVVNKSTTAVTDKKEVNPTK